MFELSALLLFAASAVVLVIAPGPAVLYIVARSMEQGVKAGIASTLGIGVGALIHVAAATFGVSALLMTSASAFATVKFLGAAYLIGLGIHKLCFASTSLKLADSEERRWWSLFWHGVLVNLLNPKTALFFFAFLPQFVDPARGGVALQTVILGLIFVSIGVTSDGVYAVLAGRLATWFRSRSSLGRHFSRLSGMTYLSLGLMTAFSGEGRKS